MLVVMVVVEGKGERGHGMLPFFTSSHGGWAEKISCTIRGEGIEKYLGEKIKIPQPHQPNNCERSLSSLLDDIMNKETFIGTVNPILFFSSSAWKANKEKRKKDRERY